MIKKKKKTEVEDVSIVERQVGVGIVNSSPLLSVHCGPGIVLGA